MAGSGQGWAADAGGCAGKGAAELGQAVAFSSKVHAFAAGAIYDVGENVSRGAFGSSRARGRRHGESGPCTRINDDFVFTDHDVVDQILEIGPRRCAITA